MKTLHTNPVSFLGFIQSQDSQLGMSENPPMKSCGEKTDVESHLQRLALLEDDNVQLMNQNIKAKAEREKLEKALEEEKEKTKAANSETMNWKWKAAQLTSDLNRKTKVSNQRGTFTDQLQNEVANFWKWDRKEKNTPGGRPNTKSNHEREQDILKTIRMMKAKIDLGNSRVPRLEKELKQKQEEFKQREEELVTTVKLLKRYSDAREKEGEQLKEEVKDLKRQLEKEFQDNKKKVSYISEEIK